MKLEREWINTILTVIDIFPSGGHINPAVSLMFVSFKQLAPVRFVLYFIAQMFGAFCGAALTYAMYHGEKRKGEGERG